jgi:tetratricopeptide (TPR) repeat protein
VEPLPVVEALASRGTNPDRARLKLLATIDEALQAHDARAAGIALDRLGDVELDEGTEWQGDVPPPSCLRAKQAYQRALEQAEAVKDPRLLGRVLHDLGLWAERCEDSRLSAVPWYQRALEQRRLDHDANGVRLSANNLGILTMKADPAKANQLFREALDAAEIASDLDGLRKVHCNLARLWFLHPDRDLLEPKAPGAPPEWIAQHELPGFRGTARQRAIDHANAAIEVSAKLGLGPRSVCQAIALVNCGGATGEPESFFPNENPPP